jgi:hypothetical protein
MLLDFTQWRQLDWKRQNMVTSGVCSSVADPWLFGEDPDPDLDPQIHASDQWIWIRMRIRILLFSSFSKIKSQKEVKKQ